MTSKGPILWGEVDIEADVGDVVLSINEPDGTIGGCVLTMTPEKAVTIALQLVNAAKRAGDNGHS